MPQPPAPAPPPPASAQPATNLAVAAPTTGAEVTALRARVRELRDAIEEATDERGDLAQEIVAEPGQPAPPPAVTSGIEARIKVIDERILRLEGERDAIDRAITGAPPGVLAQAGTLVTPRDVRDALSNGREEGMAGGLGIGIPTGLVLALAFVALRRRVQGRRVVPVAPAPVADRTITQLAAAVEATAIEVERIGESQRYLTQLLLERPAPPAPVVAPRQPARVEHDTPH